jgi:hypothetical protein
MTFYLRNSSDVDGAREVAVTGQCVVGRAPNCHLVVSDDGVAWEQVALADEGGRLYLTPTIARGVVLNETRIKGRTRVAKGDRITLSPETTILIDERVGADENKGLSPLAGILLCILVLALAAIGLEFYERQQKTISKFAGFSFDDYRRVHQYLGEQVGDWGRRGEFPIQLSADFNEAFQLEVASNDPGAHHLYRDLSRAFLVTPMPGGGTPPQSMAENAGHEENALLRLTSSVLGRSGSMELRSYSTEQIAGAVVGFVRLRKSRTAIKKK